MMIFYGEQTTRKKYQVCISLYCSSVVKQWQLRNAISDWEKRYCWLERLPEWVVVLEQQQKQRKQEIDMRSITD
jgi:hypothetical protein